MLDDFLTRVAKVYGIEWTPGLRSHEKLDSLIFSREIHRLIPNRLTALSELLDKEGAAEIDRDELRKLCTRGMLSEVTIS